VELAPPHLETRSIFASNNNMFRSLNQDELVAINRDGIPRFFINISKNIYTGVQATIGKAFALHY
jgi:hypothetical protein